jgi:hypothetical protein
VGRLLSRSPVFVYLTRKYSIKQVHNAEKIFVEIYSRYILRFSEMSFCVLVLNWYISGAVTC